MNSKLLFILGFVLLAGLAMAENDEFKEYEESKQDETETFENEETETFEKDETETLEKEETSNDEKPKPKPKMIKEDMNTETSTALTQEDIQNDPDSLKNKGLCHFGIAVWFKPGVSVRCNCMKCTCRRGGSWACAYNFAFCPYYYCGNQIYNPATQVCCCGKVHSKRRYFACCGYFYYNTRSSQCCNYFSVKPKKARCPRFKI